MFLAFSTHFQQVSVLIVCSCRVTYAFQCESSLYSCLNVNELLARSRREIWGLVDCNWIRTQNHLVRQRTDGWVFVYELSSFGFDSSCNDLKCFDLFEVIFLLRLDSLASKSVFVIKFASANLALKTSAAKVLNSGIVIYLSWS